MGFYSRCPDGRRCSGTWAQCSTGCGRRASERAAETRDWLSRNSRLESSLREWANGEEDSACPICAATVAKDDRQNHKRFHESNGDLVRLTNSR